ncbi:hypothetical protein MTR_7g022580 [Medicago truncatula]|uniref:F-box protein interaction domain protein n=1 Tax=Medicago truncatula TaxID=3880 RepID=G7KUT5_MEDTR|nr:hypothetical protein MTR_7g022580 [Medicago truncatula]
MHLNRSARNPHFSLFYYPHRFVPFPSGRLLDNRHITFPKDPYYLLHDKDCSEVIGSCNGLVCLLGYSYDALNNYSFWLRFWNPATRKISDRSGCFDDFNYKSNSWRFVFCYDKALHLSEDGDTIVFASCLDNQAILYNLRTNRVLKSRVNKKICWFSIKDYVESLVSTY